MNRTLPSLLAACRRLVAVLVRARHHVVAARERGARLVAARRREAVAAQVARWQLTTRWTVAVLLAATFWRLPWGATADEAHLAQPALQRLTPPAPALPGTALDSDGTPSGPAQPGAAAIAPVVVAPPDAGEGKAVAAPPAPAPDPQPPMLRGPVPVGKGMWIYLEERTEGGNVEAIVGRAKAAGLSHLYVRTGSSWKGFYAQPFLDRLLPAAHAAGLRVYGWDFPNLRDVGADVARSVAAVQYATPDGHRIDGFVPDIETSSEGTNLSAETAGAYAAALRAAVGPAYPLVACVPNPSRSRIADFPYAAIIPAFDAVAPMVYWLNRQPDTDIANAMAFLGQFGKPVIPVGQAYDGGPEGGRPGVPPRDEILRFFGAADEHGAAGVSFWSWQAASPEAWDAIRDAAQFGLSTPLPAPNRGQARGLQALLTTLGFPAPNSGAMDEPTVAALRAYQQAAGVAVTGSVDEQTHRLLMKPFNAPQGPTG